MAWLEEALGRRTRDERGRGRDAARLVLGIETSCDDTSVAVLEDGARCAPT